MSVYDMLAEDWREMPLCGIMAGIVTDIKDPEKKNRVKVRLLSRTDSAQETDYIRVMTPAAGKQFGFFALPEVGDEVLVGFLDGDLAAPYVLGGLWNPQNPAPEVVEDGKNERRLFRSKTAHALEMDDGTEKPGVVLRTAKETQLAMDDKAQTVVLGDKDKENCVTIDIGGGAVTLKAKSKLVLQCGKATIELNGNSGEISIKTSGNIKIDGQQVDLAGKSAINVKASGQLNLQASGPANLKGAVVKVN